jgi:hypothetical protein
MPGFQAENCRPDLLPFSDRISEQFSHFLKLLKSRVGVPARHEREREVAGGMAGRDARPTAFME